MADTFEASPQKRDYYLQMMHKAQQLNDQLLIRLISKKLARLGMTGAKSTANGCIIIPFPTVPYSPEITEYERPSWWMIFKLTLAVPGSLTGLFLLAIYGM